MTLNEAIQTMTNEIVSVLADNKPTIYLFGSVVLDDFQLGWSDIDILVLTECEITVQQADTLVGLRQNMLERYPGNPYFRLFEGGMLSKKSFFNKERGVVIYWGTSGQRVTDTYGIDSFATAELLGSGILVCGEDIRINLTYPTHEQFKTDICRHYDTIRQYGKQGWGWLLDIARGLYTLQTDKVIAKTAAGEWALETGICPVPDSLRKAIEVRKAPLEYKTREDYIYYSKHLHVDIQRFADVLEREIEKLNTSLFTPESQGISSDVIIELVDEFERRDLQVTSFVLLRNGKKIAEFCKSPYDMDSVQLWFSVTKSFTGIGVGIACDKGLLYLDDFVISFFPDKLPAIISENLGKMRVRHLLSMTSGIHDNTYGLLYPQEDWVKAFLAQDFPHEPGTYYRYSTHGSHMLAAIVERASRQSFYDFMKVNLFEPLEIYQSTWEMCSQGITAGGMGLGLKVESVAKFTQMILEKGVYNGKQIVSEEYLSAAMSEQSDDRELEKGKHTNGYGFHMRIDHDGSVFHAGAFGQLWYACPRKNIAVVLTSRRINTDVVVDLLQEKIIEPALEKSLPSSVEYEWMMNSLKNLAYPVPSFCDIPQNAPSLDGKTYLLSDNPHRLQTIRFKQNEAGRFCIWLQYADRPESLIDVNLREPVHGWDVFVKDIQLHEQKYVSYAAWEDEKTLILKVFYIETPYEVTYRLSFDGMSINVVFHMNVSLNIKSFVCDGCLINKEVR